MLTLCCTSACSGRGCSERNVASSRRADAIDDERPAEDCREHLAHASVAAIPGIGAVHTIYPSCDSDRALSVFVMRGHTLSVATRAIAPHATFAPARVVSTGADRLGPMRFSSAHGPLAWRSPTLALDDVETEEIWAGMLVPESDGSLGIARGSVSMPQGTAGLGIVAPLEADAGHVRVLSTLAHEDHNPTMVTVDIRVPSDEAATIDTPPPALGEGEIKAYEPENRVVLAWGLPSTGAGELRAFRMVGDRLVLVGAVAMEHSHVLVVARGVSHHGNSVFAYASFRLAPTDSGHCVRLGDRMCVDAGPLTLLVANDSGVRAIRVEEHALPDSIAIDARERVTVLYVASDAPEGAQGAVRVNIATREIERLRLVPSDDLPPLDHPALASCGGRTWLVSEVLVRQPSDAGARDRSDSALMAVPFECVARRARR